MKPRHILTLLTFCSLMAVDAFAQDSPESIPLWPEGKTPYAKAGDEETGRPKLYLYPVEDGNGAAVVICPGGGYGGLAIDHEGNQIAQWYNERGVAAYVLHYRLGSAGHHFPTQLADVQRALRTVRARAEEWNIDPARIGVMGFSAGGHLSSMAVTKFDEKAYEPSDEIDNASARPDFGVLCYPVISTDPEIAHMGSRRNLLGPNKADDPEAVKHVSSELNVTDKTPPTFLFHTGEDTAVPPENSVRFYLAMREHGIPGEMHIYQKGPHGVGFYQGDPILGTWSGHLNDWLRTNGFYTGKELQRVAVKGDATLNGQPISWGSVTFYPEDKNIPETTVRIRRGKFSAKAADGPVAVPSKLKFAASIWEVTGNPDDQVVTLDRVTPDAKPATLEVKADMDLLNFALETK